MLIHASTAAVALALREPLAAGGALLARCDPCAIRYVLRVDPPDTSSDASAPTCRHCGQPLTILRVVETS